MDLNPYYLFFGLVILVFEIHRSKAARFDGLTFANAVFILSYIATPVWLNLVEPPSAPSLRYPFQVFGLTVAAYICLAMGWSLCNWGSANSKLTEISIEEVISLLRKLLAISAFATLIFVIGKGGLIRGLSSGVLGRYGAEEKNLSSFDFLENVISICPVLSFMLFCLLCDPKIPERKRDIAKLYFLSLIPLLFYTLASASRGVIASVVIYHSLIYWSVTKSFFKNAAIVLPLLLLLVFFGKQSLYAFAKSLRGEEFVDSFVEMNAMRGNATASEVPLNFFFREYIHGVVSLDTAINYSESVPDRTYFRDFPLSLTRVIPQRITSLLFERPDSISLINTRLIQNLDAASTPPGLIGHFYYCGGEFAVIIGMVVYGLVGKIVDNWLRSILPCASVFIVVYFLFCMIFAEFISNGDPNVYVLSTLWPVVIFTLLIRKIRESNSFTVQIKEPACK